MNNINGPIYSIVIFLRAFRMLRLIKYINYYGSAEIINTLLNAAPQIRNILALIGLVTFIYAALGINLFAKMMYREVYNDQNNFRNIFNALILLIRSLTGEDWNKIMHDLASNTSFNGQKCVNSQTYEEMQRDGVLGCGSLLAFPFFISYFLINAIVILDLSIGVFINALSDSRKMADSVFKKQEINNFLKIWGDYDPDSTGWINVDQLLFLMFELPIPFGQGKIAPEYYTQYNFDKYYKKLVKENLLILKAQYFNNKRNEGGNEIKWVKFYQDYYLLNESKGLIIKETRAPLILKEHNIPIYKGNIVHFRDVFQQIIRNAFENIGEDYEPHQKLALKFRKKWRKPITRTDIQIDMADEFVAGRMLFNKMKEKVTFRRRKKASIEIPVFNSDGKH